MLRTAVPAFVTVLLTAPVLAAAPCEELASAAPPHVTVTSARVVPSGPFATPGRGGQTPVALPAHCRIAAIAAPTADSRIASRCGCRPKNWNGKFQAVGNGGWAGTISYPAMAAALPRGLRDGVHRHRPRGRQRARSPIGHPEKIVDFAYRAVHEMTVQVEGAHRRVLRPRPAALVLERLLDRRPAGPDGGAAVSRRTSTASSRARRPTTRRTCTRATCRSRCRR